MSGKTFLTPKELGAILGVSPSTISRRIKDKTIPSVEFGGMRLIPATYIQNLEDSAMASLKPTQDSDGGVSL
jgi:excisionase family DNA binding protein